MTSQLSNSGADQQIDTMMIYNQTKARFLAEARQKLTFQERFEHSLPMLLMVGAEDPIGGERGIQLLTKSLIRAGVKDVRAISYHGARHEVFNETNKLEVFADLLAWLDEKLSA